MGMSFGNIVIWIVMACALLGAFASLRDDQKGLGKKFLEGLHAIGFIFVPVAGIMASIPVLSKIVLWAFGPVFSSIGADPSIAATSFIAVDMGGYQLASTMAQTKESWIMAMLVGYLSGATIVFSIPVGLSMIEKKDHNYMALGFMSGVLAIPFGVLVSSLIIYFFQPEVRSVVSTQGAADFVPHFTLELIFKNLAPLIVFVLAIALGLRFFTKTMLKGFAWFGRGVEIFVRLVLVFSIVEYFTGVFTKIFGYWGFDPIFADAKDPFRALEISGYIGVMLCGAFPMVYLIRTYLEKPLSRIGGKLGLGVAGTAGFIASIANILAMFKLVKDMSPKDKVLNISFAVCAAFLFGDHLAFTANFQPNLILPVMAGKLCGGLMGIVFAYLFAIPRLGVAKQHVL